MRSFAALLDIVLRTAGPLGRIGPGPRRLVGLLLALLCGWVLLGSGLRGGGVGLIAAGGWGLGLVPVHSDRAPTTPRRRHTPRSAAPRSAEREPLPEPPSVLPSAPEA